MKKVNLMAAGTILSAILVGCAAVNSVTPPAVAEEGSPFVSVYNGYERTNYEVVYHRDTKVMYSISRGRYNAGSFTLLVNADGSPMLYEG